MRTAMRLALVKCEEEEKEETTVEWAQFEPNNGRASSESVAAATLIERASVYCPASCNLWGDEKERRKEGRKEGRETRCRWMDDPDGGAASDATRRQHILSLAH